MNHVRFESTTSANCYLILLDVDEIISFLSIDARGCSEGKHVEIYLGYNFHNYVLNTLKIIY